MNSFVYNIPTQVYFGRDQLCHLGEVLSRYGKKVLLTYGGGSIKRTGLYDTIMTEMKNAGLEVLELSGIEPNPRISSVREGVKICKEQGVDVILAVGGGSTLDASKMIAGGACVDYDPWEFFTRRPPLDKALPLVTILTLAATGSEMDNGGVISNPETNDKLGYSSNVMFPKVSFLDPTITYSVSRFQTACGAADMFNHIMEVYFAPEQDLYMLDTFMEGMMKTIIKYAPVAMAEPENYEARANLMWTSSWAINGMITGGKRHGWSCHLMEHELSAFYDITHGLGLAIVAPRWMEYCLDENTVSKYVQYGVNVFGIDPSLPPMEIARKSIEMTADFFYGTLGLDDTLTKIGIGEEHLEAMSKKACKGGVIRGFKPLTPEDVLKIFKMCL